MLFEDFPVPITERSVIFGQYNNLQTLYFIVLRLKNYICIELWRNTPDLKIFCK